jgi:hypothetical protein
MIQRETVEGRPATVAYLDHDFEPATPETATLVKVMYDDGETAFGSRQPNVMASLDLDVAVDELLGAKADVSLKDGTKKAGFVTAEDNRPPRQCDHCRWMAEASCTNPLVTADDEVGEKYKRKRNNLGNWEVEPTDCCNHFQAGPNE